MEIITKYTLDMLTKDSVSVLKQLFIPYEGKEQQVGENWRRAFSNSKSGRIELKKYFKENTCCSSAVMSMWGDEPTVETPDVKESELTEDEI